MNLEAEIAPILAEQYADMLSLDFRRRNTLLNSWHHFNSDLVMWDKRLQAYIEALKYLKPSSKDYFKNWSDSLLSRGDIFALGTFAFHTEDTQLLKNSLSLMLAMPHLTRVVESVIAWAPATSVLWETAFLSPTIRVIATYIRDDLPPVPHLSHEEIRQLMSSSAAIPGLIKMLHRQQHPDYHSIVTHLVSTDNPQILLDVLNAVLTHRLPYANFLPEKRLIDLLTSSQETVRNQAALLYLCNTDASPTDLFIKLREKGYDKRLYLTALGYSGSPANIEILKEYLDKPEYARLAAISIVMITGASPESAGWLSDSPNRVSDDDQDAALSWPDKSAFERWWVAHAREFDTSAVYVAGKPATKEGLVHVLQHGCLALHPLAKSRLCHLARGTE